MQDRGFPAGAASPEGTTAEDPDIGAVPPRLHPPRALLVTIWIALVVAAAELVLVGIRKGLFGEVLRISRQIVWLAPVMAVLLGGWGLWTFLRGSSRREMPEADPALLARVRAELAGGPAPAPAAPIATEPRKPAKGAKK